MRLEAKTACVFLCQFVNTDIRMKPRYTDAFWGEHPFDGDMILNKNKNKNKAKISYRPFFSYEFGTKNL